MANKYRHWVHLSAEGVKELGHIFKDGVVPVKCFLPAQATLGEQEQIKAEIYLIDLKQLTEEQVDLCCEYAGSLQGVPGCVVKRDICRSGELPIREKHVSGSGTSDVSVFL
jgi:hypothetical protein